MDDKEDSEKEEDFKTAINSLRFEDQIDKLRDEVKRIRARDVNTRSIASRDDKILLIEELQREIEDLIETKEKIMLDELQKEEEERSKKQYQSDVVYPVRDTIHWHADAEKDPDFDSDDGLDAPINREFNDPWNRIDLLQNEAGRDIEKLTEDKPDEEFNQLIEKIDRNHMEIENILERMESPIDQLKDEVKQIRARDANTRSIASRDEKSWRIEELQREIEDLIEKEDKAEEEEEKSYQEIVAEAKGEKVVEICKEEFEEELKNEELISKVKKEVDETFDVNAEWIGVSISIAEKAALDELLKEEEEEES